MAMVKWRLDKAALLNTMVGVPKRVVFGKPAPRSSDRRWMHHNGVIPTLNLHGQRQIQITALFNPFFV